MHVQNCATTFWQCKEGRANCYKSKRRKKRGRKKQEQSTYSSEHKWKSAEKAPQTIFARESYSRASLLGEPRVGCHQSWRNGSTAQHLQVVSIQMALAEGETGQKVEACLVKRLDSYTRPLLVSRALQSLVKQKQLNCLHITYLKVKRGILSSKLVSNIFIGNERFYYDQAFW